MRRISKTLRAWRTFSAGCTISPSQPLRPLMARRSPEARDRHHVRFHLGHPDAKFGYTEVSIGFVPAIVSSMLVWQVGHKVARDLLLSGRMFTPESSPLWTGQRNYRTGKTRWSTPDNWR